MDLRRVRYFVAVAEELHFRRAAERLHIAQPALSQQVRKLEQELGVELLHRTKRGVALTSVGSVFLDEARHLLRHADETARMARNARAGGGARLRLGHLADAVPAVLPRAISAFAAQCPAVEIVPETAAPRRAVEDVRAGRLDIAVVGLPASAAGLNVTPFAAEPMVAAIAERHLLSGRPQLALSSLSATPLAILPRAANPAFHDAVLAACRDAGVSPTLIELDEPRVEHALLLVNSRNAIALLPASAADRHAMAGVTFRALEPPAPTIELAFVTRPEPPDATIATFLRVVRALDEPARKVASLLGALEAAPPISLSA
jgi:DNA-binding transcriptional LysR family regulator